MKKALVVLFSLALLVGFTVSTASAGVYISGNLGAVFLNDDTSDGDELTFDYGDVVTFALGKTIGSDARIEVEIGYRVNDMDELSLNDVDLDIDGDMTTFSFMGNAYYDFKNHSRFITFIGGGLGVANVEYDLDEIEGDSINEKDDDNVLAYQLMLGVGYAVTEQLNIDLQYRYFATTDPEFDTGDAEYHAHNVMLGLRYSFQ